LIPGKHVVKEAMQVRLVTSAGIIAARVVKVDAANDLALLKAEGRFAALPVVAGRALRLGSTVATVSFPVAQNSILPYRRVALGRPREVPTPSRNRDAMRVTNPRYGRLQICATSAARNRRAVRGAG